MRRAKRPGGRALLWLFVVAALVLTAATQTSVLPADWPAEGPVPSKIEFVNTGVSSGATNAHMPPTQASLGQPLRVVWLSWLRGVAAKQETSPLCCRTEGALSVTR